VTISAGFNFSDYWKSMQFQIFQIVLSYKRKTVK